MSLNWRHARDVGMFAVLLCCLYTLTMFKRSKPKPTINSAQDTANDVARIFASMSLQTASK